MMKRSLHPNLVSGVAIVAGLLFAAITPPVARAQTVALVGAAIETLDEAGRLETGNLILKDGKIHAVGAEESIPETAQVVDVSGKVIIPGVIDPYHAPPSSGGGGERIVIFGGRIFRIPSSTSSTPTFSRVADNFDPHALETQALLRSGVTHINLVAAGYGQAAVVRNTPDNKDGMLAVGDGLMFARVSNDSAAVNVLRTGLGSGSSTSGASRSRSSSSSPTAKLWKEVKEGKRKLVVNAGNAAGILHLLKLLKPHKNVKLVLVASGEDVYRSMEQLKEAKLTLILSPVVSDKPNSRFPINVPAMVHKAGIPMAFSLSLSRTELSQSQDTPLFRPAMLVRAGLPRKAALEALTVAPAKILGLEKTHGSIAKGKMASLLVFDGDPLDPSSQLEMVYVEGVKVYEN